jgi:hypothetical protein
MPGLGCGFDQPGNPVLFVRLFSAPPDEAVRALAPSCPQRKDMLGLTVHANTGDNEASKLRDLFDPVTGS